MMKKSIAIWIAAVALVCGLAGCSRNTKPSPSVTISPTPSATVPNDAGNGGGAGGTNDPDGGLLDGETAPGNTLPGGTANPNHSGNGTVTDNGTMDNRMYRGTAFEG